MVRRCSRTRPPLDVVRYVRARSSVRCIQPCVPIDRGSRPRSCARDQRGERARRRRHRPRRVGVPRRRVGDRAGCRARRRQLVGFCLVLAPGLDLRLGELPLVHGAVSRRVVPGSRRVRRLGPGSRLGHGHVRRGGSSYPGRLRRRDGVDARGQRRSAERAVAALPRQAALRRGRPPDVARDRGVADAPAHRGDTVSAN